MYAVLFLKRPYLTQKSTPIPSFLDRTHLLFLYQRKSRYKQIANFVTLKHAQTDTLQLQHFLVHTVK